MNLIRRLGVQQHSYETNSEFVACGDTFQCINVPLNLAGGSMLIPSFPLHNIFFFQTSLITTYITTSEAGHIDF